MTWHKRSGRKAAPPGTTPEARSGLLAGLPRWVQDHARTARRGAKTPLDVTRRWGGVLDGILGRYMQGAEADTKLAMGADWEGLARVVTLLAEARRKLAATEAELTPKGGDGANITHDLTTRPDGKPDGGPPMWGGDPSTTIATVTGSETADDGDD